MGGFDSHLCERSLIVGTTIRKSTTVLKTTNCTKNHYDLKCFHKDNVSLKYYKNEDRESTIQHGS